MFVIPTFTVSFRLGSTGPEFAMRVPETDLRAFTAVLIFNGLDFSVKREIDPFGQPAIRDTVQTAVPS